LNTVVDDRPTFPLANMLELADGRQVEWEAIGTGGPLDPPAPDSESNQSFGWTTARQFLLGSMNHAAHE
jgi:hypothetical protein